MTEDCQYLSALQSIAVDFAKHGECVSPKDFEGVQQLLDKWPDFFEKSPQYKVRISSGILGKLYREINNTKAQVQFMKNEFKFSIKLKYTLDLKILKMATHPLIMHAYLPELYTKVYVPFERALRSIMISFKVANEGELYGTDLRFKLCDDTSSNYYKCDPGLKHENAIMALN